MSSDFKLAVDNTWNLLFNNSCDRQARNHKFIFGIHMSLLLGLGLCVRILTTSCQIQDLKSKTNTLEILKINTPHYRKKKQQVETVKVD